MAKRKATSPELQPPTVPPDKGLLLLKGQIEKANQLIASRPLSSDNYSSWELLTRNFLEKAFGINSPNVSSVMNVGKFGSFPMNPGENWWENHRANSLQTQIKKLEGLIELLQTEIQLDQSHIIQQHESPSGHRVFLVHGHDEKILHESARFLEKLQQDIVILREQPNKGRTIIEKFEDYADVGFAIVLLTADDRGGKAANPYEEQKRRARQNVILELGYFLGRLGRNRVCALFAPGVEIPSDYSGVLYVPLDDQGAWRLSLAKEMKAAGLSIDMNLAL
jgi:predicted nucleotide-binding protein